MSLTMATLTTTTPKAGSAEVARGLKGGGSSPDDGKKMASKGDDAEEASE